MKVLVLGGTGFIGRHVATRLAKDGHDVTVFHRGEHEPDLPLGVRHVRDPSAAIPIVRFPATLADPTPDVVIHMVPMGERDARAAVRAFRNAGRLVAVSSGDVYRAYGRLIGREPEADDEAADEPPLLDENAPLRTSLYPYGEETGGPYGTLRGYDKILVERAIRDPTAPPSAILRLPRVYGPGDRQRTFEPLLRSMEEGGEIRMGETWAGWRWTHGYVENVAAAITLAAVHPAAGNETFNVGESPIPTMAERARMLADVAGWSGEIRIVPDADAPEPSLPIPPGAPDLAYDTSRLRNRLGFEEPIHSEEGMRLTANWLRAME